VSPARGGARGPGSWLVEVDPNGGAAPGAILRVAADQTVDRASATGSASALVFDGVLHNRNEIKTLAKLEQPAANDAEVLLHAYERVGETLFSRLRGTFALIVWDGRTRSVLAVRDPLGVVPLFYASIDGTLLLSTAIDTLLRDARVSASPNRVSLAAHLLELWPPSGETLVEPVCRVPPAHLLRWGAGESKLSRYWDPADGADRIPVALEEVVGRFEELLLQSVDRCLEQGAAGIFLSGGLDSGTVAALAAERSQGMGLPAPWALSLVYPHPSLNEEKMQRRVATALGLPQVLLPFESAVGGDSLLLASLKRAATSPAPPLNLWRPAYDALIAEAEQRDCKVILTGEGGDEWLVPHPLYAADRLASFDLGGLRQLWASRRRATPFSFSTTTRTLFWEWGLRPLFRQLAGSALLKWSPSAAHAYRRRRLRASLPDWLAPDPDLHEALVDLARDALPDPAPGALHEQGKRRLAASARLGVLMEEWLEDGRRAGVRLLSPLLDADLVAFLYHVPPEILIHGGQPKWLARAALADRLQTLVPAWPRPVYADRFWLSQMSVDGPGAWSRMGGVPALAELGVVDPERFDRAVQAGFSTTSFAGATQVWATWTLETWLMGELSPIMVG
jgi:asparagine synthetase B (glutamine-hydrolysing)